MGAPIPRGPPPSVPVFKASAPIPLKFADLKTISHAAAVRSLYTELPHLSKSDGMRFSTKEALREHLDWLFRQNRRKRARSQSVVVGGTSRCWYEPLSVFLGKEESSSGKRGSDKKSVGSVNANETVYRTSSNGNASDRDAKESNSMNDAIESKGDNEVCQACNESFESYWDDDKHAWMLKEATRTDDGEVFHPRCVELTEVTEEVESEDGNEIEGRVVKEEVQEAGSGVNKRKREATEETAERQANVNEEIEEGKEEKSNKRTKVEKVDSSALTGCDVSSG